MSACAARLVRETLRPNPHSLRRTTPMQLSFTGFVIAAFAVWRVAHLIACEDGPGDILVRLHQRLGSGFAGSLMDCFNCVSIWISAPALLIPAPWPERIITWLGISGAACLLERVSE